jgi:lysophospholipase L1-like esterase
LALLDTGSIVRPTVLLVGDSYLELAAFPQAIATSLYAAHGKASDGWLSAHNPNSINGITRTTVGAWTNYDASDGVAPVYGCGIDGKSTSTTGTDKREIFYNIKCTEFTVYYYDGNGAMNFVRYAADGITVEATTPLVFGGTNTFKSFTFTGQPDQLRNYEVNTANNTGAVVIHGYRATRNSAAGVIVDKCGNAGATSDNLTLFSGQLVNYQAMQPDLIVVALGTNNASVKSTTKLFESDVPALIDSWRALWPNVGIVLIAEPLCTEVNGAKQSPLIDYRDAAYEIALSKSCEFYSMFDDWADFTTMSGLGMFLADGIHPSVPGSAFATRRINQLMGL